MPAWVAWLIAAAALAVGEVLTLGFFLGPIAVAAALAAIVAGVGLGVEVQIGVFAVASLASLVVVRPIARRHLHTPPRLRSGTAALVGASAVVLERVDARSGSVRLRGEVWSARAFDSEQILEPGVEAQVIEIDGATALVSD